MSEPTRVSYDLGDVLQRMDEKLERMMLKLDSKADAADVWRMSDRLTALEQREQQREKHQRDTFSRREKVIALSASVAALALQGLLTLGGVHHL